MLPQARTTALALDLGEDPLTQALVSGAAAINSSGPTAQRYLVTAGAAI